MRSLLYRTVCIITLISLLSWQVWLGVVLLLILAVLVVTAGILTLKNGRR